MENRSKRRILLQTVIMLLGMFLLFSVVSVFKEVHYSACVSVQLLISENV